MSGPGAMPVFVDTGPLYARFDDDDQYHETSLSVFQAIASGDLVYQPLFVTTHVLGEFTTLALQYGGPEPAAQAVTTVRDSELFTVVRPTEAEFDAACQALERYSDQRITLVDHLTGVLADSRDVDHVFSFDNDFQTLEFTLAPEATGDPEHSRT